MDPEELELTPAQRDELLYALIALLLPQFVTPVREFQDREWQVTIRTFVQSYELTHGRD